jgi:hypothetical protein
LSCRLQYSRGDEKAFEELSAVTSPPERQPDRVILAGDGQGVHFHLEKDENLYREVISCYRAVFSIRFNPNLLD